MMRLAELASRLRRDEQGAAWVWLAVFMPVALLVAALVIDFGKWFEDKRHLQTQVDAAAFAGALNFSDCFSSPAVDSAMATTTLQYSGDQYRFTASPPYNVIFNPQISDVSSVHAVLNQTAYWQSGDANVPGQTWGDQGSPCTSSALDVKATHNAPSFFFGSIVPASPPAITAHSRVEARLQSQAFGALPFAIPNLVPQFVFAQFVDQTNNGAPITGWTQLTKNGSVDPSTGAEIWTNIATPTSVTISSARIAVRLKVNEGPNQLANCGDPLVTCMEQGSTRGLVMVRGWTDGDPATGPPVARDVLLTNTGGDCTPDPYFVVDPCHPGIDATVAFGDRNISDAQTTVTAVVNGSSYSLTKPVSGNVWSRSPGTMSVGAQSGANDVTLNWNWWQPTGTWRGLTCTSQTSGPNKNPCQASGTFGVVQSSYLADPSLTSRVQLVQVGQGAFVQGKNSFQRPTSPQPLLSVTVGITGLQNATKYSDPTILLRNAGSGSNTQSINCNKNGDLRDAVRYGCTKGYAVNPLLTCPNVGDPSPSSVDISDCATTQSLTGGKIGQLRQGMNDRFSCTVNHWQPPNGDPTKLPTIQDGDPRLVSLVITTWNAFATSGSTLAPVVSFADFYVTGWDGNDACAGADANAPYPFSGSSQNGDVWGKFIKHVGAPSQGGGGQQLCNLNPAVFGSCIAVLTN